MSLYNYEKGEAPASSVSRERAARPGVWGLAALAAVAVALAGAVAYKSLYNAGGNYIAQTVPAKPLEPEKPVIPDFTRYSAESVRAMIPLTAPGGIAVSGMDSYLETFPLPDQDFPYGEKQGVPQPQVIFLQDGIFDLATIYEKVNNPAYLEKNADGFTLKIPLYVSDKATLVIAGPQNALKLSADTAAFILSMGKTYIVDTAVTGWSPALNGPALFRDSSEFRPYLYFSSNSESYLANTTFSSLGYSAPKSYGVTFSTSDSYGKKNPGAKWPRGWLVDSTFSDLYFGFYSYEAEDVFIIHNLYKDNIVYGIDPHDRSRRLTIAENEVYGSKKKHGIIVSREVSDSLIVKNSTHDNEGSGIMIERNSRNNIVAWNESIHNGGDGLSIYESPNTLSWSNSYRGNGKSGIRIRNSVDVRIRNDRITGNGAFGIEAYTDSLAEQEDRDLSVDHFEERVSVDIAEVEFSDNPYGQINIENAESARFQGLHFFRIGKGVLKGDLEDRSVDFYAAMTAKTTALEIKQEKTKAKPAEARPPSGASH